MNQPGSTVSERVCRTSALFPLEESPKRWAPQQEKTAAPTKVQCHQQQEDVQQTTALPQDKAETLLMGFLTPLVGAGTSPYMTQPNTYALHVCGWHACPYQDAMLNTAGTKWHATLYQPADWLVHSQKHRQV